MIHDLAEELQAIEEETFNDGHCSEVTQEIDLEQEDSEASMTEDEKQWLAQIQAPQTKIFKDYQTAKYYKDIEAAPCQLDDQNGCNINHAEEVIIGSEQGTTFPTKLGTTVCNALIDCGATRCCISEEYYRKLWLSKIGLLQNNSVRSATGSNLAPIGLVNCTFMLGDTLFEAIVIVCKNHTRPLILGRDFLIQNHIAIRYSKMGNGS